MKDQIFIVSVCFINTELPFSICVVVIPADIIRKIRDLEFNTVISKEFQFFREIPVNCSRLSFLFNVFGRIFNGVIPNLFILLSLN